MDTVVITDGKYRASIAAARMLGRAGYRVAAVQAREDQRLEPPVFASRYVQEGRWLEGAANDPAYPDRLYALLESYGRSVLFCAGAATLNAVSKQRERFGRVCDFLIAPPHVLDALNDKAAVHRRCAELGIPVPAEFDGPPDRFPVVVKPHCGEKFGLKAKERYAVARNSGEYAARLAAMSKYDPHPIVQEKVEGEGAGASLLLDRDSRLIAALCHRRVREYPASGGPSTCCESFYDESMIGQAYELLASFGFVGMAMVEFKGGRVLEVNPRVWGTFPLTRASRSGIPLIWHTLSWNRGNPEKKPEPLPPASPFRPCRMQFGASDLMAGLGYLRRGQPGKALGALGDFLNPAVKDGLWEWGDPKPGLMYYRSLLKKEKA